MAKEIFMPKLSSTMEVGTLLQWFKEEGESIDIGEPLFEIMTDKINIEVEAYDAGVLLKNTMKSMIKSLLIKLLVISERKENRYLTPHQASQVQKRVQRRLLKQKMLNHKRFLLGQM